MSDLRERVAEIFTKAEYGFPYAELVGHSKDRMLNSADAAIALVLEEAAKVAEERLFTRSCTCSFDAAAAIRALKGT